MSLRPPRAYISLHLKRRCPNRPQRLHLYTLLSSCLDGTVAVLALAGSTTPAARATEAGSCSDNFAVAEGMDLPSRGGPATDDVGAVGCGSPSALASGASSAMALSRSNNPPPSASSLSRCRSRLCFFAFFNFFSFFCFLLLRFLLGERDRERERERRRRRGDRERERERRRLPRPSGECECDDDGDLSRLRRSSLPVLSLGGLRLERCDRKARRSLPRTSASSDIATVTPTLRPLPRDAGTEAYQRAAALQSSNLRAPAAQWCENESERATVCWW